MFVSIRGYSNPSSSSIIEEGAMQFVRDFNSSVMKNLLEVSIDEALEGIKKLGTKPQEEELKSLPHIDCLSERVQD